MGCVVRRVIEKIKKKKKARRNSCIESGFSKFSMRLSDDTQDPPKQSSALYTFQD